MDGFMLRAKRSNNAWNSLRFAARTSTSPANCWRTGAPGEEILREAQRFDLILLGKHAHFEAQGSDHTLTNVLRSAPRPVVTVPDDPPLAGTVLVAYDGGRQAALRCRCSP